MEFLLAFVCHKGVLFVKQIFSQNLWEFQKRGFFFKCIWGKYKEKNEVPFKVILRLTVRLDTVSRKTNGVYHILILLLICLSD